MTMWDCTLQITDDCQERGFDPPPTTLDNDPVCGPCSTEAKRRTKDQEADHPWRITD